MTEQRSWKTAAGFQEMRLREHATRAGVWYDLVSFLGARCAWHEIDEIRARIPSGHRRDRLICDVLLCDVENPAPASLIPALTAVNDTWLYYTFAKYLLRRGRLVEAMALAREALQRNLRNVSVVNLVLNYLVRVGELSLARLLLEASLGANPVQKDIETLFSDAVSLPPLYLAVAPRQFNVTFYIPMFRVERYLRFSLEGIFSQNYPLAEVIAVNDASPDASRQIAAEYPVRILDHECNRGLAAARNTAFRAATGDFVATVDTDAYAAPDYLRRAMMEFENAAARVVGIGGRMVELHREFPADLYRRKYLLQDGGECRECPTAMLFGCSTVFRRDAVLALGGYNEQFRTNAEDADISKRLSDSGQWLVYSPDLVSYHMRMDTPESVMQTRWRYYYWYLHQNSCYKSPAIAGHILNEYVKICSARLQQDRSEGNQPLLYLHVLMLVHSAFLDLKEACREGMLSETETAACQRALWSVFSNADAKYGTDLAMYLERDTKHLLINPADATDTENAFFAEAYGTFLANVSTLLTRELCSALCASRARVDHYYQHLEDA